MGRSRLNVLVTRKDFETNQDAFVRILDQCGLLRPIRSAEQQTLHNFGISLLENAGGLQGAGRVRLLMGMVRQILAGDIPEEAYDRSENGRR